MATVITPYGFETSDTGDAPNSTNGTPTTSTTAPIIGSRSRVYNVVNDYDRWNRTFTPGTDYYGVLYVLLPAYPVGGTERFVQFLNSVGNPIWNLRVTTSGTLQAFDQGGNPVGGTITLELNKAYLVDYHYRQHATVAANGFLEIKVDNEVITSQNVDLGTTGGAGSLRVGPVTAGVTLAGGIKIDKVGMQDSGYYTSTVFPGAAAELRPSGSNRRPIVPIGFSQVNNVRLQNTLDRFALRWVPESSFHLYRFLMGFNLEGVNTDETGATAPSEILNPGGSGRSGYSEGNGGSILAQLTTVNSDGTPNLNNILAFESVNAVQRYKESKALYGTGLTQIFYLTFDVDVTGGTEYCVVISNDANDHTNYLPTSLTGYDDSATYYINPTDLGGPDFITDTDGKTAIRFQTDASPGQQGVKVTNLNARTFKAGVTYRFRLQARADVAGGAGMFFGAASAEPAVNGDVSGGGGITLSTSYQDFVVTWTPSADRTGVVFGMKSPVAGAANTYYMRNLKVGMLVANNYFSVNCPTTARDAGGPHNQNSRSKFTVGAIAGLDPREACAWSVDSGSNWVWGEYCGGDTTGQGLPADRVGGHMSGCYNGTDVDPDEAVRMPWFGWQPTNSSGAIEGIQPYTNYLEHGTGLTLTCRRAGRAVTLTKAGGFAPAGANLGTITVTNISTGVTGSVNLSSAGDGIAEGTLSTPVPVAAGETYTIASTGDVYVEQADSFQQTIFGLGGGDFPFSTNGGYGNDRAALYATPWPYFAAPVAAPANSMYYKKAGVVAEADQVSVKVGGVLVDASAHSKSGGVIVP